MYREDIRSDCKYKWRYRHREIKQITHFIDAVSLNCGVDELSDKLFLEILGRRQVQLIRGVQIQQTEKHTSK